MVNVDSLPKQLFSATLPPIFLALKEHTYGLLQSYEWYDERLRALLADYHGRPYLAGVINAPLQQRLNDLPTTPIIAKDLAELQKLAPPAFMLMLTMKHLSKWY
ncbi:MAG: hypothetical protein H0W64_11415 [Gammaproteobacteria bacterium]|nr:hypothetical protein [Gammaproteobacteria bacterium]